MSKTKDCLGLNQINVYEWNDMSTHGLLCIFLAKKTRIKCHQVMAFTNKIEAVEVVIVW